MLNKTFEFYKAHYDNHYLEIPKKKGQLNSFENGKELCT